MVASTTHCTDTARSEIADAKGRLLCILLTGGETHDCSVAERLIRRTKAAAELLGDKAYDSAELRGWMRERGTKAVIPNRSNRKQSAVKNLPGADQAD